MKPHLELHQNDAAWAVAFAAEADLLEDNTVGQLSLWPLDDLVSDKRYVRCPRRGAHIKLTDCWMCWCDVAYGHATADEVLDGGDL